MDEGKLSLANNTSVNWRILSALTVAVLIFASLLLPQRVEEMRTGYWAVEHFLAYFLAAFVVFKAWRRPLAVAATLVSLGVLLEVLQCLYPIHSPNPLAALSSVSGVLAALPIAMLLIPRAEAFRAVDRAIVAKTKLGAALDPLPCSSFLLGGAGKSQQLAGCALYYRSMSLSRGQWIGLLGATAVASLAMAALLPTKWVPRTGLGWEVEHFLIYFATTFALCVALRQTVPGRGVAFAASRAYLRRLQNFTPDRTPDLTAAFAGGSGAILGAALFTFVLRAWRWARSNSNASDSNRGRK